MIKKTINKILSKAEDKLGVKILKNPGESITACKSELGFWYTGNVLDKSDIAYGILQNGIVEKEETNLILEILKTQDSWVFYDIGANTGYYGILTSFLNPNNTVYSFEPLKEHTKYLKESIEINNLKNITCFDFGLGDSNRKDKIYLAGSGSSLIPNFSGKDLETVDIEIKKGDDFIRKNNIKKPDLLKIDVEGFELKVINGFKKTISEYHPVIFMEIIYSFEKIGRDYINENFEKTFNELEKYGYKTYIQKSGKVIPFDKTNRPDGVNMYLFLHDNHKKVLNYVDNSN